MYAPSRTLADELSVPKETPLNVRKVLEVPGIFAGDAVLSKGLLYENPLVSKFPQSRPTETKTEMPSPYPDFILTVVQLSLIQIEARQEDIPILPTGDIFEFKPKFEPIIVILVDPVIGEFVPPTELIDATL